MTASSCGNQWRSTSTSPKKHSAGELYPTRLEDEARAWQWSFWGMTEVEPPVHTALMNRAFYPEERRDAAAADAAEKALAQPLRVPRRCGSARAPTCSGRASPSPTSTSPASSPGRGRPRSNVRDAKARRVAQKLRRAPGRPRRAAAATGLAWLPARGYRRLCVECRKQGGLCPAMDRDSGDSRCRHKVPVPAPISRPLQHADGAVTPDHRFLYAGCRATLLEPLASFACGHVDLGRPRPGEDAAS